MNGVVVKVLSNCFSIFAGGENYICYAKKKKNSFSIFVGDIVLFDEKALLIENVQNRKNLLKRPPIANIDKLFIVISPLPKPDLSIVDKLLVIAYINQITPIIIVGKSDLTDEIFLGKIKSCYSEFVKIIEVSSKLDLNIDIVAREAENCVSVFAGQSAVGKSSLLNKLIPGLSIKEGEMSARTQRGKNTTCAVELYKFKSGFIADSPGFNLLDEWLISCGYQELKNYYPDFTKYACECKFNSCMHQKEKNCAIIQKVNEGLIDKERYNRYISIKESLFERWKKKYE